MTGSAGAESFARGRNVSRETLGRLECYVEVLGKWNRRINLVSPRSFEEVWTRHIADSAQLFDLAPNTDGVWLDMGSGGGLPAIVIAVLARRSTPGPHVVMVESDQRKAAFLAEAVRRCDLDATIIDSRIEQVPPLRARVVSARALAPLSRLLEMAESHVEKGGICLFPKGPTVHKEIDAARVEWRFEPRLHASRTNPGSHIVEIGDFERV